MSQPPSQSVLVATKTLVPRVPESLVPRHRLTSLLDKSINYKMTLVLAGAGYGKTTLLSEWFHHLRTTNARSPSIGWVSLDSADNDPVRFWRYILLALDAVFLGRLDGMTSFMRSIDCDSLESFLDALVNELSVLTATGSPEDEQPHYVIVLDDYHFIVNEVIHQSIDYFLDYLPPDVHLIMTSRTAPPLSLALRRARNQLLTLDISNLRFTNEEAAEFLARRTEQLVSAEDVESLQSLVEGWVAGLQLSALSIGRVDLRHFVNKLKTHERDIGEFLAAEVLAYLPSDITHFLLATSILSRLSSSLCDATTNGTDSEAKLVRLERENMFVTRLDNRWYRYHPLFAELLRGELERTRCDEIPQLNRRAAEWYEVHLMPGEAIRHAMAAEDWERVARLINQNYRGLIMRGRFAFLTDVLDKLAKPIFDSLPTLYLVRAWTLLGADRPDDVEPQMRAAEQAVASVAPSEAGPLEARMRPEVAVLRATALGQRGDAVEGVRLANQAFLLAPKDDLFIQSWALNAAGTAAARGKDPVETIQVLMECRATAAQANNTVAELISMYFLAQQYVYQGRLHKAKDLHEQALGLIADRNAQGLPYAGLARIGIGDLQREWNMLPEAEYSLRIGMDSIRKGKSVEFLADAQIALARTKIAQGDLSSGLQILEDTILFARERRTPRIVAEAEAVLTRFQLQAGDRRAALRWMHAYDSQLDREDTPLKELQDMTLARVHHAYGRPDDALRILDERFLEAAATERFGTLIEVLVLRSLVLHSLKRDEPAFAALEQALELAEPEGHIRVFADEGRPINDLLRDYRDSTGSRPSPIQVSDNYVERLLSAISFDEDHGNWSQARPAAGAQPLLTDREAEVCRLLVSGYSDREIAHQLFISENTVHTHRRKIYAKLGAHSRRELIQQVRALGIG